MSHVGIIGAGPAGLTAAYQLAKAGRRVTVLEAGPRVGGLAQTIDLWGQKVDLGPHRFFSSDARVNRLWLEVVGRDYKLVDRLTRIYYQGKLFKYPIKAQDAIPKLGPVTGFQCLMSYLEQRLSGAHGPTDTFEDWVVSRFGRKLFEIFFKSYSEKLWGISCQELDADFAAQRIKKLSLLEVVKSALSLTSPTKHRTLVDRFAYPCDGTGMVYERMAHKIVEMGGEVLLSHPVKRLVPQDGGSVEVELTNEKRLSFDKVISTMPLTLMVASLPNAPEGVIRATRALTFRNTILVFAHMDSMDLFPDNWVYVHAPELKLGRLTNFRNWVPELYGDARTSILALEFWCNDSDELWSFTDDQLIGLAKQELEKIPLTSGARFLEGAVKKLHRCYPVYKRGYKEYLDTVVSFLKGIPGISVIGRYGAFKYNNQDHSILMGILAAENIIADAGHDLWAVNTDYESYQEKAIITETGLTQQPA